MEQKLFINGKWVSGKSQAHVKNKFNGEVIGTIDLATEEDVFAAIEAAEKAAPVMAGMSAYKRSEILHKVAKILESGREEIARIIAMEVGKTLKYARVEADRAAGIFTVAAEEAKRIGGEIIPLDAVPSGDGYFGFTVRRPVGIVGAITPFNFPLNLVAHKVAPAIAAGNTVVLKPASSTPFSAGMICRIFQEAGLPDGALNLVQGSGRVVGDILITNPKIAKISFTGSPEVGEYILSKAGIKKVTLELGNTGPVIITSDADLDFAAKRCAVGAFYNAGQVCISVQRIYVERKIYKEFLDKLVAETKNMLVGDPLDERMDVGPMIDILEAERIESWVKEAVEEGATIVMGGHREGAVYWPTILTDVKQEMKVISKETFAPVVSVVPYDDFSSALRFADGTDYGLQASVFTKDIGCLFESMKTLNYGGIIVNDTPTFRTDHMPYGGNRQSGLGREGVRYAIEEMTNIQMIAIRK